MKVLVYGAGVIGSYLAHVLYVANHDVSILARGTRKTELEEKGLIIQHFIQKETTVDPIRIVDRIDENDTFDIVFVVMQYQQMWAVLGDIAASNIPRVVLIGNNMSASDMERYIFDHSASPKTVLFGFQGTGGRREDDKVICIRKGPGKLTCGLVHSEPDIDTKRFISDLFTGTEYVADFVSDMDAWYKCHLAFVLPAAYVCYATGCDLKKATRRHRRLIMAATLEGFNLLEAMGYPILPAGSKEYYEKGFKKLQTSWMYLIMAKSDIGKLAVSDHCRNAVSEMQSLNEAFQSLRGQKPDFPMPAWSELEQYMPK